MNPSLIFIVEDDAWYADLMLNNAEMTGDLEAIAAASHKIKSSIDIVSTPIMRDLILKINQSSRKDGDITEVKLLLKQFNAYYKMLEIQLREEVNSMRTLTKVG